MSANVNTFHPERKDYCYAEWVPDGGGEYIVFFPDGGIFSSEEVIKAEYHWYRQAIFCDEEKKITRPNFDISAVTITFVLCGYLATYIYQKIQYWIQ
tara:strand:- start:965 stop:1255 length:291 start_codon:yes stop_codon:yes gene_type:complete